jgi:hypothetical protein
MSLLLHLNIAVIAAHLDYRPSHMPHRLWQLPWPMPCIGEHDSCADTPTSLTTQLLVNVCSWTRPAVMPSRRYRRGWMPLLTV